MHKYFALGIRNLKLILISLIRTKKMSKVINGRYALAIEPLRPKELIPKNPPKCPDPKLRHGLYINRNSFTTFYYRPEEQSQATEEVKGMVRNGLLSEPLPCRIEEGILQGRCMHCCKDKPVKLHIQNHVGSAYVCEFCLDDYKLEDKNKTCFNCGKSTLDSILACNIVMDDVVWKWLVCSSKCLKKTRLKFMKLAGEKGLYLCAYTQCKKILATKNNLGKEMNLHGKKILLDNRGQFCIGCLAVKYCNKVCQKKDWSRHKEDCLKCRE